jgi:VanZ family protein
MYLFRFHFYTFIWAGIILLMSLYPGKELPTISFWQVVSFDKFMHISCYMLLFFLMIVGAMKQYGLGRKRYKVLGIVFTVCLFYGIIIEILQPLVSSDRIFDYFDVIANLIGCIFGIFLYNFVYSKNEI